MPIASSRTSFDRFAPPMTTSSSKKADSAPSQKLLTALSSVTRWKIIGSILAEGPMGITDLAAALRSNPSLIAKHVAVLRKAGVLYKGRGRLSYLAEHLKPAPGVNEIDFGHCVFRFPAGGK
jgi:Bacterial regulatory protein, arsR family